MARMETLPLQSARRFAMPRLSLEPALPLELPDRAALMRLVAGIGTPDAGASVAAQRRWDGLTKPLGSLGILEELVVRLAGIAATPEPRLGPPCIVVMCADNGVTAEGVSSCPREVTATVTVNFTRGMTGVNVFASQVGSALRIVDIGVDAELDAQGLHRHKVRRGTANIATGPAMSEIEALKAIGVGIGTVEALKAAGYGLLGTGEMGIGNTTTSAAVLAALLRLPVSEVVGRGSGLSDKGLRAKAAVIERAIEVNRPDPQDPLGVLAKVGGLDLAGLVGCYLGAALYRLPIVVDGLIAQAAALVAARLAPRATAFIFASHRSAEPGSAHALRALGLSPMFDLGLRLGEGTGAALAFPLFDAALAAYYGMGSFEDAQIEAYQPQG